MSRNPSDVYTRVSYLFARDSLPDTYIRISSPWKRAFREKKKKEEKQKKNTRFYMQALEYEAPFATARYRSPLVKTFNDFSKICVSVSRYVRSSTRGDGSLGRKIISVITQRENREGDRERASETGGSGREKREREGVGAPADRAGNDRGRFVSARRYM